MVRLAAARPAATLAAAPGAVLRAVARRVACWRRLARERRTLATLDARLLRDIGVEAGDAAREADRPFWDAPVRR